MAKFILRMLCTVVLLSGTFYVNASVEINEDAPRTYTVKKGDTLWDIASQFLAHPWQWPELWRRNTQLNDPHLIYPGDILSIQIQDGVPVLSVVRTKPHRVLSPEGVITQKPQPIPMFSSEQLNILTNALLLMSEQEYDDLPRVLGEHSGKTQFSVGDNLISELQASTDGQLNILRRYASIENMQGEVVGVRVERVAQAQQERLSSQQTRMVTIVSSHREVRQGDKLAPMLPDSFDDIALTAATDQRGFVIGDLHDYEMLGLYDVVVLDLSLHHVTPGTAMGIYSQGPDILVGNPPTYQNKSSLGTWSLIGDIVEQPAVKVGELVVVKTFDGASFGLITRADKGIRRGMIVAHP